MDIEKETTKVVVLGHKIYLGEGGSFTTVRSGKTCMKVNLQVIQTSRLRQILCVIEKKGSKPKVPMSRRGSTP
jgi:hypothetical protein